MKAQEIIAAFCALPAAEQTVLAEVLHATAVKGKKPAPGRGYFTLNQISAKSSEHAPLIANIMATLKRFGFVIDPDKPIDVIAMEKAFAGKDVTTRIAIKSQLSKIGALA